LRSRATGAIDDLFTTTNTDNGEEVIARSAGPIAAAVPAYLIERLVTGGRSDDAVSFVPAALTAALLAVVALLLLAAASPDRCRCL
jgi:hypothetical protein